MERSESIKDGQPQFNDDVEIVKQVAKLGDLRILLVSDIHLAYENIILLKNWYFDAFRKPFDYVFVSGDLTNLSYNFDRDGVLSDQEEKQAEKDVYTILKELEIIAPLFFIPGNHDSKRFFKN